MLKSLLYYLLFLTTTVRFVDIIYLMTKPSTNLPVIVLVVTSAMIIYGVVLLTKRVLSNLRLKQLTTFYVVQSAMIVFNIIYMAISCPLQVSFVETLIVGTFLDLLMNFGILYACMRQMRGGYAAVRQ